MAEILEESRERITPATVISELTEKNLKEGFAESEIDEMVSFIASQTRVYSCDLEVARKAGGAQLCNEKEGEGRGNAGLVKLRCSRSARLCLCDR